MFIYTLVLLNTAIIHFASIFFVHLHISFVKYSNYPLFTSICIHTVITLFMFTYCTYFMHFDLTLDASIPPYFAMSHCSVCHFIVMNNCYALTIIIIIIILLILFCALDAICKIINIIIIEKIK